MRTGYLINVYMDANPYSATYGQEMTERVLNTTECQTQQPANYVLVYTYCEMAPNGAYTGNCVAVYEDVEPLSPTYGEQMEQVSTDQVLCPPDSAEADWQQVNEYCEQIAYQPSGRLGNSGYMITVYQDMGEYSPTYGQTREDRTQDLVHCTPPSTFDVWLVVSETCHLENGVQDGTKDVVRVETNEYSPNYNDGIPETINVPDTVMCPPDQTAPVWTETSYVCEQENGYNTGYTIITEEDTNSQSSTYGQTRTRRVSDDVRCPVQTPDMMSWRIINNRSVSTDTITSITLNFNTNAFAISASGSLAPGGGQISGSSVIPANLKSTALSCTSITLSPNAYLPTLYQYSQTPATYTWNTDYASTLIITLWDGDGTGPEWTETSYTCETVSGYRTGAAIIVEEDMNPESATYGQTRTRTVEYDSRCPAQTDGDWVETSWSCQQESGYNTGYVLSVQTDQNPNSSSYNTTRTRIIYDTTRCPIDTTPGWVVVSWTCEQEDGNNTGNATVMERDVNPNSSTYNETRTRTVVDLVHCPIDATFKLRYTTSSGSGEIACNGDSTLTNAETSSTRSSYITAEIGGCVTTLGAHVFDTARNLQSATIPNSVTIIGGDAFYGCSGLTGTFNIPNSVTEIGWGAFMFCRGLQTVNLPSSLETIGWVAFSGCEGLTSISIPENVSLIDGGTFDETNAFEDCYRVASITVNPNNRYYDSRNNCNAIIETATNKLITGCKNTVIPDTVTEIGRMAFSYMTTIGFTSITIPASVTVIGQGAFYRCIALQSITCLATTPPTLIIGHGANYVDTFDDTNNCPIYVPAASVNAYKAASGWSRYASRIQAIPT